MATDAEKKNINEELKIQLKSLIISSAKGLTVRRLRHDYRETIGADVPFKKLEYQSFDQYLLGNPDICRLEGYGEHALIIPVVNEKNKHINEMVMKQKPPKSNSRYRPPRRSRGIYNYEQPAPVAIVEEPIKLPVTNPNSHERILPPPDDYIREMRQLNRNKSWNPPVFNSVNSEPKTTEVFSSCDSRLSSNLKESAKSVDIKPNQTSINYCEHEDSDSYDEFLDELNFSDDNFSYKSNDEDEDVTTSLSNLVIRKDEACAMLDPPSLEEPHVSRVNKKVKDKLQQLISEYPDGIWCSKLLKLYYEKYHQKLDPLNFGFSSVIQMCDDLPDVFYSIRPNRTDWKLYDKRKPVPDLHTIRDFNKYLQSLPLSRRKENTEPALPENYMHEPPNFKYPDYVMQPDEKIKRQWLINGEKPEDYIKIIISEVYDPSKFWIQLKDEKTSDGLEKLMDDMQLFYMHNAGSLQLNEFSVRIGLYCAALFMNEYHRAIIIKVFDDQTIKVFYIDYGTVAEVQLRRTCLLHRNFSELPMQAIRARLANIIPKEQNTMWPRAASQLMLQMVSEKVLIGYIHAIDYEEEILELIVTDTTTDVDVHINDVLVEKDFAVLGNEAPLCESSLAIVPNVHLYPAFEEVEHGIYPNVGDVIRMLKLGHTYETIFHGYFDSSGQQYQNLNYSHYEAGMEHVLSMNLVDNQIENEDKLQDENIYRNENIDSDLDFSDEFIYQESVQDDSNIDTILKHKLEQEPPIEIVQQEILLSPNHKEELLLHEIPLPPDRKEELLLHEIPLPPDRKEDLHLHEIPLPPDSKKEFHLQEIPSTSESKHESSLPEEPKFDSSKIKKPPPGFENFNPSFNPNTNTANNCPNIYSKQQSDYVNLLYTLTGYPLMQTPMTPMQNFPGSNAAYNLYLTNPALYNQLLINQQRESLLQTVQQYKFVEELQKYNLLMQMQQPNLQMNFGNQTKTNVYQCAKTDITSNNVKINKDSNDNESNKTFSKKSISNVSEHICDRSVLELQIKDCTIHVLKLNDDFFVVSQELISNLLKSNLSLKNWLKTIHKSVNSFPCKLVNIMDYEHVYNEVKRLQIPGISSPNNLGCFVRLTSINDVEAIVRKYGNKSILSDLKSNLLNVQKPYMWKVLDSSD